ncbi:iron-containing alcohol dehydrogenase [soil metagenome]
MGFLPETIDLELHLPSRHGPLPALRRIVDGLGATPVIVTDSTLAELVLMASVRAEVGGALEIIVDVGEPTTAAVGLVQAALIGRGDVVVAVGGGSVIDIAKLAGALVGSGGVLSDYLLSAIPFTSSLPVVAIPTTAGSGAEVTRTSVVSVDGRKSWAWDEMLRPNAVVLDPALTLDLPASVTVATGLDALVHAIEAATARRLDSVATELGLWAVAGIGSALPSVIADPADIRARGVMLSSSTAAGLAIDRCGTGIAHGLGHALGSIASVPHGLAVALCLEVAAPFNVEFGDERCAAVARALGGPDLEEELGRFMTAVGLDAALERFAADQSVDSTTLTNEALADLNTPMRLNNVRPAQPSDVASLAEQVAERWEGVGGRR